MMGKTTCGHGEVWACNTALNAQLWRVQPVSHRFPQHFLRRTCSQTSLTVAWYCASSTT